MQSENQQQAADQVSISNSIGSLRFLEAMDWREFVETMSVVEQTLREDPGGVYGMMDFATRDRYRHVVETIAKASRLAEHEVARHAIQLARTRGGARRRKWRRSRRARRVLPDRQRVAELERTAQVRRSPLRRCGMSGRFPLCLYLGAIAPDDGDAHRLLSWPWRTPRRPRLARACSSRCCRPGGESAGGGAGELACDLAGDAAALPRMDFSGGIPPESRTLVVVPTLLTSAPNIEELIEALEVRFLANRDDTCTSAC